jgi:hypothetical protein
VWAPFIRLDGGSWIPQRPGRPCGSPTSILGKAGISPELKRPEREANNSPPSSADIKNGGAILPLFP